MSNPDGSFGPAVGEPPVFADPRRWGAGIGVVGGLVFIVSYAAPLGAAMSVGAELAGLVLAVAAVVNYWVRPTSLGPFRRPGRTALMVYVCCVVGELLGVGLGSRLLAGLGRSDLSPAMIAVVVGVHFLPFAWAFGERLFYILGCTLVALGGIGLSAGYAGMTGAAEAAAVLCGLVMLMLLTLHGQGRFAHHRKDAPRSLASG